MSAMPKALPGGLELRWGEPGDAEELAEFNIRIHSDTPGPPEQWLGEWTRLLCSGRHPTTRASDFTVIREDEGRGRIVSSLCLISQTWAYDGVEFGCGRPELVGTDPDHRKKGLVDLQMEVIHALSAERGELVQAITGIPWLYRKYGYDMGLDLGGGRRFYWQKPGNAKSVTEERFRLRDAAVEDIDILADLYEIAEPKCMVTAVRDEILWQKLIETGGRENPVGPHFSVITNIPGEPVGYLAYLYQGTAVAVREIAVLPGR
jgi:predicted acetyltransferase